MSYPTNMLSEVFRDTEGHYTSSEIIAAHSSNKEDIREFALRNIDFLHVRQVMDLGCGFGFFTQALKDKISRGSVITGIDCLEEYRRPFISLCKKLGFKGHFFNSGIEALSDFKNGSVDLILSSFSIYFFPEVVEKVASILKKSGTFIVICHYSSHLRELTDLMTEILKSKGYPVSGPLPHDKLIGNFPAEDGKERLSGYFKKIEQRKYLNELIFKTRTINQLVSYIRYKRLFFIPEEPGDEAINLNIEAEIGKVLKDQKEFRITKNDGVFICTHPV
jgi:SAM-dependent methyltransferase